MLQLRPKKSFLGLFLLFIALTGSLATNFAVNTGQKIEFGQGAIGTVSCDSVIGVNFTSYIDSATGNFILNNVVVRDLSVQLHGKKVQIDLRDESRVALNSPLTFTVSDDGRSFVSPFAHIDSIDATSAGSGPIGEIGRNQVTFTKFVNADSSTILSEKIKHITVQTTGQGDCSVPVITCAHGGTCAIGDTGPDSGTIIYAPTTPFTDTSNNQQYRYIEVAPANWYTGVVDPRTEVCVSFQISAALPNEIGNARSNTNTLLGLAACNTSTTGHFPSSIPNDLDTAAKMVRAYGSDWNVPTLNELQLMCKAARFGVANIASVTNCNDTGGSTSPSGWLAVEYASSSKVAGAGFISRVNFQYGISSTGGTQTSNSAVRPIRYIP